VILSILALIGLAIPNTTYSDDNKSAAFLNPLESLSDNPTTAQIKLAITFVANKYGLKEAGFYKLIECESQFLHKDQWGDNYKAYGILQYHKDTFLENCAGDYYSAKDQLTCGAEMIKKGMGRRWTCIWAYLKS